MRRLVITSDTYGCHDRIKSLPGTFWFIPTTSQDTASTSTSDTSQRSPQASFESSISRNAQPESAEVVG